jgi:predicted O-linked N-acetylglucosamine transferase (SPINDLY family)
MAAFIRPLLSRRDASRYEVYCYAVQDASDAVTQEFRNLADGWRDLSNRSFVDAAQCIFDDGVDILFDLSGHTHGGCTLIIAAYKPAPVQISGLGWFNTTGLSAIDYFLTDPFLEDDQEQFCEQLLMLPRTHMVYMPGQPFPLPSYGRRKKGVTFGCFNNFAKITNEMLVLWLAIVRSVPGSRLCLQDTLAMPVRCIALRERAVRIGWHQEELELSCGSSDYLSNLSQIDIGLDPYPYPGGSMTCAALYMGVPVVAMAGIRHGSRLGVSLLSNAGLSELIAENPAAYKKIAVSLATDTERCMNLHRTLRQMMQTSRIMDAGAYMYDMEQAYEEIWRIWLNSQT